MLKDEWLDVMNDIIGGLKEKNEFPEWYEGLHKALYRANEFMGNKKNLIILLIYLFIYSR
jgi:hypothetical protein